HRIGPEDAAQGFVRTGLWDQAGLRVVVQNGVPTYELDNDEAEDRNFIGRDSRRFYFEVTDATADTDAATEDRIAGGRFQWFTSRPGAGGAFMDDDRPADASLTLLENG